MISNQERIAFHRKKQQTMLKDFQQGYAIPAQDWQLPADMKTAFLTQYHTDIGEERSMAAWQKTVRLGGEHSGPIPQDLAQRVQTVADEFAPRIAEAFYVHAKIDRSRGPDIPDFYKNHTNKAKLGFIYKNHLCNELDARLMDAGLDAKSAYLTMSHLLGQVMRSCRTLNGKDSLYQTLVLPERNRGNTSDTTVQMERTSLQRYWSIQTRLLDQWVKLDALPDLYHTQQDSALGHGK